MSLHEEDINWEKDAPHIASAGRANPFLVPSGYFSEMHEHLLARIEIMKSAKHPGMQVPEGYFDRLPELIEAKIAVEELKEELSKEGFKVPEGYFGALSGRISERVHSEQKASTRLVPLWISYVAAACVTIAVGITLFINSNQSSINERLAEVPAVAIESYLSLYTDPTDVQLIEENMDTKKVFSGVTNHISEKELQEYIEETTL